MTRELHKRIRRLQHAWSTECVMYAFGNYLSEGKIVVLIHDMKIHVYSTDDFEDWRRTHYHSYYFGDWQSMSFFPKFTNSYASFYLHLDTPIPYVTYDVDKDNVFHQFEYRKPLFCFTAEITGSGPDHLGKFKQYALAQLDLF